jgi:dienelactone hydrolase
VESFYAKVFHRLGYPLKTLIFMLLLSTSLLAELQEVSVEYAFEGKTFEGKMIYHEGQTLPRVFMVPNWMGMGDNADDKAKLIAKMGFQVYIVDMYGKGIRPTNHKEASAAATAVRGDRALMRRRALRALEQFEQLGQKQGWKGGDILAIGFCFGGGTVLEMARSGTDKIRGAVSFHGNLDTPDPELAREIKIPLLVLHGADDPYVPDAQVNDFLREMRDAKVDFQLVHFGGAVHSFTNPEANSPGASHYDAKTAQRAFGFMRHFATEVFKQH